MRLLCALCMLSMRSSSPLLALSMCVKANKYTLFCVAEGLKKNRCTPAAGLSYPLEIAVKALLQSLYRLRYAGLSPVSGRF